MRALLFLFSFCLRKMDEDERRLQLITDQTQCCRSSFVISPSRLDEDDDGDAGRDASQREEKAISEDKQMSGASMVVG